MDRRLNQRSGSISTKSTYMNDEDVFDEDYEDVWPSRMPSSARRYHSDVETNGHVRADVQALVESTYPITRPGRRSAVPARSTAAQPRIMTSQRDRRAVSTREDIELLQSDGAREKSSDSARFHWLFYVGLAMCIMTVGWALLSVVSSWGQGVLDDWHYGRPRTAQYDVMVGHNDSVATPSHFIALNLNRHIEIIEFPGGDATKAKMYVGPVLVGDGQDLVPATLSFKDVNGDGKLDMIVNVRDNRFVFINDGNTFRPLHPGEMAHL